MSTGRPADAAGRRWRWHGGANALVLLWLAAGAGLAGAAALGAPAIPSWLGVHTLLLGAATTAIVVWSEHFSVAVAHAPAVDRRWSAVRLGSLTAGQLSVVGGVIAELTWLLAAGAVLVAMAVAAHGVTLFRLRRRGLGGRLSGIIDYYLVASASLVAGAVLGGLMGSGLAAGEPWHSRVHIAHIHLNVGGWVLLTVVGTLFMLLPTTLRTVMAAGTQRALRWCLRLAGPGLALAVAGLLAGSRPVAVAGVAAYLAGVGIAAATFATTVVRKRPDSGPSWMLAASTVWLLVAVVMDLALVSGVLIGSLTRLMPVLLVGVVAQVLIGSLTYLLPVVLGGGPALTRAAAARLQRWWPARLVLLNLAVLMLAAGGVTGQAWLTRSGWLAATLAALDFVVRAAGEVVTRLFPAPEGSGRRAATTGTVAGIAVTGFAVLVAMSGTAPPAPSDEAHGGHGGADRARVVDVTLTGMRVDPPVINVPPGTDLTLRVSNLDSQAHDLRTGTGKRTPLLGQGQTATLALGPVTGELNAWCTVAGHRAAGMRLSIKVTEQPTAEPSGLKPYEAALPAAPAGQLHKVELAVLEKELEVAPGLRQKVWTFNGSVPGPVLRGKVGDVFEVTLVNSGSMGHGIDFHAGALAPDGPMRTIQPGERLLYRFRAERAGVWMYHCSTAPMTQHIGAGMFGAVIIDPPDLAPVAREYVLVASELYRGDAGSDEQVDGLRAGTPDGWAFNGTAHQYDRHPLAANAGERVRFWLLNAGPGGTVSFHIVGTQFYTTYLEGSYLLRADGQGATQSLALAAAQGGFVETVFPEAGHYPLVDHDMRHAEGGAHGLVTVR